MSKSHLQSAFLREVATTFEATQRRIVWRLDTELTTHEKAVLEEELRGLFHGLMVIFDGGSSLADQGLVRLVDDDGVEFDRFLHEICASYWPVTDTNESREEE